MIASHAISDAQTIGQIAESAAREIFHQRSKGVIEEAVKRCTKEVELELKRVASHIVFSVQGKADESTFSNHFIVSVKMGE